MTNNKKEGDKKKVRGNCQYDHKTNKNVFLRNKISDRKVVYIDARTLYRHTRPLY